MSLHIGDTVIILNADQLFCDWLARYAKQKLATVTSKYQRDNQWYYNTREFGGHYKEQDLEYYGKSSYVEECCKAVSELYSRAGVNHDWKTTAQQLENI
jgi:hypothetical protein